MGYFTNGGSGGGAGVSDHGALTGLADDDHTQYSLISSGTGAPATTPSRVGEIYIDTTADVAYISTGTVSSVDWTLTNDGAGDMLLAGTQTNTGAKTFNSSTLIHAGSTSGTTTVNATAVAGTTTLTLPAATDTLVGKATTDTLTNKTINTASNTITVVEADISDLGSYITVSSTDTLTNKTFDANGTGNSLSNVDVADLANGTDGELITWSATGTPTTVPVGTATHVLTSNGVGAAPTFQAAAGGGGVLFTDRFGADPSKSSTPQYITGPSYSAATTTISTNNIYYVPWFAVTDATFTRIGVDIVTAAASSTTRLGIYEVDATTGGPGALVVDAGTVDSSTTGVKEITISETLTDYRYFLCIISDGAPTVRGTSTLLLQSYLGLSSVTAGETSTLSKSAAAEHTSLSATGLSSLTIGTGTFPRLWGRIV